MRCSWKIKLNKDISLSDKPTTFFGINGFIPEKDLPFFDTPNQSNNRGGITQSTSEIKSSKSNFELISLSAIKSNNGQFLQIKKQNFKNEKPFIIAEINWNEVVDKWLDVEAILKFDEKGYYKIEIKDSNGKVLMSCEKNSVKMLLDESYDYFYPYWGIYRTFDNRNKFNPEERVGIIC